MEIRLTNVAKHFGREVVFKDLSTNLPPGSRTAILGPNGSGKSTLLQTIAGVLVPTQGTVEHIVKGAPLAPDEVYRYVSIAAPYLGLYEDLSLEQAIALLAAAPERKGGKSRRSGRAAAPAKGAAKKSAAKKSAPRKAAAKKTARKSGPKKAAGRKG